MTLNNLTTNDLVAGISGNCFSFSNARQTMLSRVHSAGDDLPINKHDAFTVSLWTKVNGTGQNDLRVFPEANTGISDPLFNLGTHNVDGTLDLLIRQSGWTTFIHITTLAQTSTLFPYTTLFRSQTDGTRTFYIDGVADALAIPAKAAGTFNMNDTTRVETSRASPGYWVTGLIDEVALWKRAITQAEITQLRNEGLTSVFPPVAKG